MGGINEKTIAGLRTHENSGEVHIHDDARSLKFKMASDTFKTEIEEALKDFEKNDGILEIPGDASASLCLVKKAKNFTMFLLSDGDVTKDLKSFIGTL